MVIYNAMKTDKETQKHQVICDINNIYFTERYKAG